MLQYLDTFDSDSDFILESDTDDTSEEEENGLHATPQLLILSYREEDDMDDEDYREILSPEQPLALLFQLQELSDLSICLLLILLLLLTSISSSQT
jgi:hypothetical protein